MGLLLDIDRVLFSPHGSITNFHIMKQVKGVQRDNLDRLYGSIICLIIYMVT